jgi:hypothetical protein
VLLGRRDLFVLFGRAHCPFLFDREGIGDANDVDWV